MLKYINSVSFLNIPEQNNVAVAGQKHTIQYKSLR